MDAILADFREQFGRLRLTEEERTAIQRQTETALGQVLLSAQASRASGAATAPRAEAAAEYHPTRQQVQAWTAVSAQAAAGATKRESELHALEILIADKLRQLGRSVAAHFVKFDYTGNGMLTAEEFSFAIAGLGLSVSDSEARAVCSRYDTSGDGTIDFAEFVSAISSINPSQTEVSAAIAELPAIAASSIPAAGRRGPDHAPHSSREAHSSRGEAHGPAVTSLSTVPSLTGAERVTELRRAAGSKLLRRHKSVSAVWRAAHRASAGSRSPGPHHQVQSGVTVDALSQLLRS
jgi:hypothetical protein